MYMPLLTVKKMKLRLENWVKGDANYGMEGEGGCGEEEGGCRVCLLPVTRD